jgi:TonB-dependent starch-binding outer membrane protein SusC
LACKKQTIKINPPLHEKLRLFMKQADQCLNVNLYKIMKQKTITKKIAIMSRYMLLVVCLQTVLFTQLIAGINNEQLKSMSEIMVKINVNGNLEDVLKEIERVSDFKFSYNRSRLDLGQHVSVASEGESLSNVLIQISRQANVKFKRINESIHVSRLLKEEDRIQEQIDVQQRRTVTGRVTSQDDGSGLPGVNVLEMGTGNGTVTNIEGAFSLSVAEGATLVFSSVGYVRQEVLVGNRSVIDLVMAADVLQLQEVVAIGYGTQNRVDLTGSVSSVSADNIRIAPVERFDQAIQGRSAGVMVRSSNYKPGSSQTISIRGINSISGSNSPLFVVDGIIGANINSVNTNDIESIDILKDAAAASIYGSRGANGVVLITTRKGRIGKPSLRFDASYGIGQATNKIEMMNAREYMEYVNDVRQQSGAPLAYPDINNVVNQIGEGFNWWDEMIGTGVQQQYYVSLDGGTESVNYTTSVGYLKNDAIISNVDYSRLNIRFNVVGNVTNRLKLGGAFSYSGSTQNDFYDSNWSKAEPYMAGLRFRPTQTPYDANGRLIPGVIPNPYEQGNPHLNTNVLYNLENEIRENLGNYMQFNFTGEYKLADFLRYNAQVGWEPTITEGRFFRPSAVVFDPDWNKQSFPYASKSMNRNNQWLVENLITFDNTFSNAHRVTAIAGNSAQKFFSESFSANARDFPFDSYEFHNLGAGNAQTRGVGSGYSEEALQSFFSRINYDYLGKYYFQVNARYDGSSKFASGNKWAFFPSAAVAWRFSDESFFNDLGIFDDAKLRISHGSIGSHGIGRYATLQRIGNESYAYTFNDVSVGIRQPIGIANKDLKWETTTQTDIGLDLGFFNGRLNFVLDYYHKKTTDLLLRRNISIVNYPHRDHEPAILSNIGSLENKGFEFSMDYFVNLTPDLRWKINLNGTFQRTTLIDLALPEGTDALYFGDNLRRNYQILQEGMPYGNYVGYRTDGLYQTQEEIDGSAQPNAKPGDLKYVDVSGDGAITGDDFEILGNALPKFFGGFNSSFSFKNFDLSFFMFSMLGHSVFNYDAYTWKYGLSTTEFNKVKEVATKRWTGPGTSNDIPRAGYNPVNITDGPNGALDVLVEKASFLRLKHLTLAYNLPQQMLSRIGFSNTRIYVQGQNLLTFTAFSGVDPEVNTMGSSTQLLPLNTTYYPAVRTYLVGINLGF